MRNPYRILRRTRRSRGMKFIAKRVWSFILMLLVCFAAIPAADVCAADGKAAVKGGYSYVYETEGGYQTANKNMNMNSYPIWSWPVNSYLSENADGT
jgi:hypothetical protein